MKQVYLCGLSSLKAYTNSKSHYLKSYYDNGFIAQKGDFFKKKYKFFVYEKDIYLQKLIS